MYQGMKGKLMRWAARVAAAALATQESRERLTSRAVLLDAEPRQSRGRVWRR